MRGPFLLPADVAEGDWIEIGQLGPMVRACALRSTASTAPGLSRWRTRLRQPNRFVSPPDRSV